MASLITATQGRVRRAWLSTVAHLREVNTADGIELSLHRTFGHEPLTGLQDAGRRWAAGRHGAYVAAGQTTSRWIDNQLQIARKAFPVFDAQEPPAVRWAQQNQLDGIREVNDDTRAMIHEVLVNGARSGANPRVLASQIRDSIGLTDYQIGIVENYRHQLESGEYAAALQRELSHGQSDRVIAAALRNETTLTQAQINKAVDRYRANMVRYRAEVIARTEALRVAHQGSDEMYRQAIASGDLKASDLEQEWHIAPLPNVRDSHKPMDGQTRAFGESFESGDGVLLRYPCDPAAPVKETAQCRCVKTTRIISVPLRPVAIAPESEAADDLEKASWDEGAHPRDEQGRFSEGDGGGSEAPASDEERATAAGALQSREFVTEHASRLSAAGDEVRAAYPRHEQATDAVHAEAQAAIQHEAVRIARESAAHGGDAELKDAAAFARDSMRRDGGSLGEQHAAAMDAIANGKDDRAHTAEQRAAEDAAISAGHVSDAPRSIADAYEAGVADRQREIDERAATIDQAHNEAADAVAALREYASDDHDHLSLDLPDLVDSFDQTHAAFSDVTTSSVDVAWHDRESKYERDVTQHEAPLHPDIADHEGQAGHAPHPDQREDSASLTDEQYSAHLAEHEAWHAGAMARYQADLAAHTAEFKRRADAAQTALERLAEAQVSSTAALKATYKEGHAAAKGASNKLDDLEERGTVVNEPAFAHHPRDENGDLIDEHVAETHANAHSAAESMLQHARDRVDNASERDLSDVLAALREETKSTNATIRELSRITGRKPAVARPKR